MTYEIILSLLQIDLGEMNPDENRKAFLLHTIKAAESFITREGIELNDNAEDQSLVEMYAAYLIRKRDKAEGMPRSLRWTLNNRLFSQKGKREGT